MAWAKSLRSGFSFRMWHRRAPFLAALKSHRRRPRTASRYGAGRPGGYAIIPRAWSHQARRGEPRETGDGGGGQVQGGPQPGMVEDGYRFLGGNPADPNSWEPANGGPASQAPGGFPGY